MRALLVIPKFGGRPHILGPYTEEQAKKEKQTREGHKVTVSMDFPKPVAMNEYQIINFYY